MSQSTRLLVADDDALLLSQYLANSLRGEAVEIDTATSAKVCVSKVMTRGYDIILLDINFTPGGLEGLEMLRDLRTLAPDSDIIMLSSVDDKATILKAMERGASNYVIKSQAHRFDEMLLGIRAAIAQRRYRRLVVAEGQLLAASVGAVFESPKMRDVFALATVARKTTDRNVLITGPTGVGKDVVARAISRTDENVPFVTVNCGAIAPSILESELFGFVKGAFTGALKDKAGMFEAADGGDIFLDEVACLSPKAQVSLLRVLQCGDFSRVGSSVTKHVNVRVIAATNEDLLEAVRAGRFREDLLARLNLIPIAVPALKERREDIAPIIRQTIDTSDRPSLQLTADCQAFLEAYSWPQNVRQLKGVIGAMIAFATGDLLTIGDIPREILTTLSSDAIEPSRSTAANGSADWAIQIPRDLSLDKATQLFQTRFIEAKIAELLGPRSVKALAIHLGMPRMTLTRRLQELGINLKEVQLTPSIERAK